MPWKHKWYLPNFGPLSQKQNFWFSVMVQLWNGVKIDIILQMYEKIGCHANSYYFFQLLNQHFRDNLHLGGCEGVIYFHKVAIGQI